METGDFLPFSRGHISAPFPIENSHLFSQCHVCFPQLRKVFFFRDHYYLWETMTHVRIIFKHLCLSGMLGIIQTKITWFWGYILLPLLCSMSLISPNFDVKLIIFPNFGQRPFPKIAGKSPGRGHVWGRQITEIRPVRCSFDKICISIIRLVERLYKVFGLIRFELWLLWHTKPP